MANEIRLIDANALMAYFERQYNAAMVIPDRVSIYVMAALRSCMECFKTFPTVDAVEAGEYEALVGMYHELRENFIDYVCSGIRNEAPYCLNKCDECVDKHGWCKLENCKGFNPAEVILRRNN